MKDYMPFTPSIIKAGTNGNQPIINGGTLPSIKFSYAGYPIVGKSQVENAFSVPYTSSSSMLFIRQTIPFTSLSDGIPVSQGGYQTSQNILASRGKSWGDELPVSTFYSTKNTNVDGNYYSPQSSQEVMGTNNNISPDAKSIKVQGNNNNISALAENISIVGDNNIVLSGVKNVTVVGNNQNITKSNVSYFHGTIIDVDGFRKDINIVKSPTNSANSKVGVISGGKNSVRASIIFKGGQDRV
jgi:hypothetical protein